MGRDREYADNADRQRAYRERKKAEEEWLREELERAQRGATKPRGRVPAWKRKPVPDAVLKKLARVLGMLGSDSDTERDMASRAAAKIVKDADLSWFDILNIPDDL
jgi:hypothetical protein